jgi:hypothetical protein
MRIVGSSGNGDSVPGSFSEKLLEGPITREVLIGFRTRGLRRRLWYSTLSGIERGFVDLTIRWADKVRSGLMAETLLRILVKLALALETGMGRVLGRGRELALRASSLAVGWGNSQAYAWRYDEPYALALGLGRVTTALPGRI